MKYRVIGDRILVQRDTVESQESGLMLPDEVTKAPRSGFVLTVGGEVKNIKIGERVLFNQYAGYFLEINQTLEESDLIVMREDEVLAIEIQGGPVEAP